MNVDRIPLIGGVIESGADDRVLDGLVLVGPLIVILPALFDLLPGIQARNLFTEGIAVTYLLLFVAYVAYLGLQ